MVSKAKKLSVAKTIRTRVTKGGQITLPAHAREALGVSLGDDVDIRIDEDGKVTVLKPKYTLEQILGSLPPPRPDYNIEQGVRDAMLEMADELVEKMHNGRG